MNCRSAESLVSAFLEDDLNQTERRAMEAHLLACRNCSATLREVRASLALMQDLPPVETGPHFEEDVMARIRSGEGLRPSLVEWLRASLEPARLRPWIVAGAGACAIWVAVVVYPGFHKTSIPAVAEHVVSAAPQVGISSPAADVAPAAPSIGLEPQLASGGGQPKSAASASAASTVVRAQGRRESLELERRGDVARVEPTWSGAASYEDSTIPNPGARFVDEYITDQFYLERELGGSGDPTITPVSDRPSDDVYIIF